MLVTTTAVLDGKPIRDYLGVVTGEVIVGANIFKDLFASVRDVVGGRSGATRARCARRAPTPLPRWCRRPASWARMP